MYGGEVPTSRTPLTPEAEKKYRATVAGGSEAESRAEIRDEDPVQADSANDSRRTGAIPVRSRVRTSQG
jgi:hypothetical protein